METGEEVKGDEAERLARSSEGWQGVDLRHAAKQDTGNERWDGTLEGVVRLWPRRPEDFIESACQRLSRNLSLQEWKEHLDDTPYAPTCAALPPSTR